MRRLCPLWRILPDCLPRSARGRGGQVAPEEVRILSHHQLLLIRDPKEFGTERVLGTQKMLQEAQGSLGTILAGPLAAPLEALLPFSTCSGSQTQTCIT